MCHRKKIFSRFSSLAKWQTSLSSLSGLLPLTSAHDTFTPCPSLSAALEGRVKVNSSCTVSTTHFC